MMKAITIILISTILIGCQGPKLDPVIQFVIDNHGQKVGHGNCKELMVDALSLKYDNFYEGYFLNPDSMAARSITDIALIEPGDLIMIEDTISNFAHVGIVTDVSGDSVIYAAQNVQKSYSDQQIEIFLYGQRDNAYAGSSVEYDMLVLSEPRTEVVYVFNF